MVPTQSRQPRKGLKSDHRSDPLLAHLACPTCRGPLERNADGLWCRPCRAGYPRAGGIVDFAPEMKPQPGLAQVFMESSLIAAIYEDYFRPILTFAATGMTYGDEEAYLDRWFEPAGGPILDLACGSGRYTRILARKTSQDRLVGLDLSVNMLEQAHRTAHQRGLERILWVRGSALGLPFPDDSLGAVNCFGALHLIPDPGLALAEIGRTLKPGGGFTGLAALRVEKRLWRELQPFFSWAVTLRFFEKDELMGLVARAGLELLDISPRGSMTLLAARKRPHEP